MSYTTNADLLSLMHNRTLVQLTSDDPLASEPDWAVVGEARAYADAQVDARLRQRYALPVVGPGGAIPRELRDWALALTRRWLYERRLEGEELPPTVKDSAHEALQALDAVRDGKLSLALPASGDGAEITVVEGSRVRVAAPGRLFGPDQLSAY